MFDSSRPDLLARLRGAAARLLGRLPPRVQVHLSRRPPVQVDGQTLDPSLQLLLAVHPRRGKSPLTRGGPTAARARLRRELLSVVERPTAVGAVQDVLIEGGEGALSARHYAPPGSAPDAPLLVYLHGGGHVLGDLDTVDEPCRLLCVYARQHILSLGYRLAPEHPAPAALHDARRALRWAQTHAAALGADPTRVAIGGDSAGANLAAVVAQKTAGDRPPVAQLLLYPPTDRMSTYPSGTLFDGFHLRAADRDAFHNYYTLGTGIGLDDPRISPLLAPSLAGLAPTLAAVAGFDILRDEAEAYASALASAGVPVEIVREPSLTHGFIHFTTVSPAAHRATVALAERWRAFLDAIPTSSQCR